MLCKFCNKYLDTHKRYINCTIDSWYDVYKKLMNSNVETFLCDTCKVFFDINKTTQEIIVIRFNRVMVNDCFYTINVNYPVEDNLGDISVYEDYYKIMLLPFDKNINLNNIVDKIKMWLLFS